MAERLVFWATAASSNPGLFVYTTALTELALSFALIFGFLRKISYTAGFFYSHMVWSVPEGFGGPYGPSSTDIGAGIIYALCFLLFIILNATFGPNKYSLDAYIEKKWRGWKKIAEIRSA